MCIAILKTKKGKITDNELRNSFNRNPDGAGIAYTVNNKLIIKKGIFGVEEFILEVRNAEKVCDNNMLIHCRIGTSGKNDERNTHPFYVNNDVCLIHNGVLDIDVPKDSDINDTQIFIKKFMKDIKAKDLMHNKSIQNLIAETINSRNKFVLLDNKGYYKIINEKAGHWKNNVWFSNSSYEAYTYTAFTTTNKTSKNYLWYDEDDEYEYRDYLYDNTLKEEAMWDGLITDIYELTAEEFEYLGDNPVLDKKEIMLWSLEDATELCGNDDYDFEYLPNFVMEEYNIARNITLGNQVA